MSLNIGDNFNYLGAKPLDNRLKYNLLADMVSMSDYVLYDGCLAFCVETNKTYQWKSSNSVDPTLSRWREFTAGGGGQTIQVTTLPTVSTTELNKVYQYIGTSTEDYINGYFYKCIEDETPGIYKWKQVNTQPDEGQVIQLDVLPEASNEEFGKIYQYIGTSNVNYIRGYFYECVEDETPGTYKWRQKKVQAGEGGQSIQVTELPDATIEQLGNIYQYIGATTPLYTHGYFYECIANGSSYSWVETEVNTDEAVDITLEDFNNLSQAEKDNGTIYFVIDAEGKGEIYKAIQVKVLPAAGAEEINNVYQYIGITNATYTHGYFYECIEGEVSGSYVWKQKNVQPDKEGQIIQVNSLPTATLEELGKIYQYTGTTNQTYLHGYFYQCVVGETPNTYLWKYVKVQNGQTIQVTTLPTASIEQLDNIYQYVGTTTENYINGYFYECIEDETPGIYKWKQKNIQPDKEGQIIQISTLPTATSEELGKVYQYIGITNQTYTHGYFYECVEGEVSGSYEWKQTNVQAGGGQIIQVDTLPIAAQDIQGRIIQYIGVTNQNFTNGYFYKCIEDEDIPGTYKWKQINIQPGGGQTIQYAVLPTASQDNLNQIVQYIGETDSTYTNGYFYKCVQDGSVYFWVETKVNADEAVDITQAEFDILPQSVKDNGTTYFVVDAEGGGGSGDGQTIQVKSLPIASLTELSNIYQYIGESTIEYINGYFYECVEDKENLGNYIWEQKQVQPGEDLKLSDVEDIKRNFTVIPYVEQPIPMTESDVQAVKNAFVIH